MINLVLSSEQLFSESPTPSFPYQEWSFSPGSFLEVPSFIGGSDPSNIVLSIQIKNYIALLGTETYSEFRVYMSVSWFQLPPITEYASFSGPLFGAGINGFLLTQSNLNQETTIQFQNLELIPEGFHQLRINHEVKGKLANGSFETIASQPYYLTLNRLSYYDLALVPQIINFHHVIGQPLPTDKSIKIHSNGLFNITCGKHISLSGGNLALVANNDGLKNYGGSGTQTAAISLDNSIETEGEQLPYYVSNIEVFNFQGYSDASLVRTTQLTGVNYSVTPLLLSFKSIKEVLEASEKFVTLTGIGTYTIVSKPSWLTVSPMSGDNSQSLLVKPISSQNLFEGEYTGDITINTSSGNFTVNVVLEVSGLYELGFDSEGINFTNDLETITKVNIPSLFQSTSSQAVHLSLEALVFDYGLPNTEVKTASFKKATIKGYVNYFSGNTIRKMMKSLEDLSDIGLTIFNVFAAPTFFPVHVYYEACRAKMSFTINPDIPLSTLPESVSENVKFLKGRRPSRIRDGYGIIDANNSPIRVTSSGRAMFNCYRESISRVIRFYKNGVLYDVNHADTNSATLFGVRLNFSQFSACDVIEARIYKTLFTGGELEYVSQKYIMFPEGNNSYHIGWENEHGLLELMEFTGDYEINTEYKNLSTTTFKDYVESTTNIGFIKDTMLTANTGWLLKSNLDRINSLSSAKRAWLFYDDSELPISLYLKNKKVQNVKSDKQLTAFQIEFQINPTNELENYTF